MYTKMFMNVILIGLLSQIDFSQSRAVSEDAASSLLSLADSLFDVFVEHLNAFFMNPHKAQRPS